MTVWFNDIRWSEVLSSKTIVFKQIVQEAMGKYIPIHPSQNLANLLHHGGSIVSLKPSKLN